jgi:hypothetical protein
MPSLPGTTIPAAPSADTGNARTRREAGNGRSLRKDGQAQGGETATTNAFTLARETTSGSTRVKESSFANARPRFGDASKKNGRVLNGAAASSSIRSACSDPSIRTDV